MKKEGRGVELAEEDSGQAETDIVHISIHQWKSHWIKTFANGSCKMGLYCVLL